ncbi:transketolase [Candidatus Pacearchaeota archaeon]|nr:transketolase [Candidatus Pacearchaeota archaeon]|tara:strand:- start:5554 stop:6345 length:792 start_codon:yes stop_codon:yes gene_type:complete
MARPEDNNQNNLKDICKKVRRDIVELLYKAQTCHLGSDLSIVEILVALYFNVMTPEDRFILSKGHGAAALYAVLAEKGHFDFKEVMESYGKPDTKFLNLVNSDVPGVEFSTGALGHGLPVAVGLALAKKRWNEPGKVFCLISDGELDCGTTWESALFAAHHKLTNLVLIIDNNRIQACGEKMGIMNVYPIAPKFGAFGWGIWSGDGHDTTALITGMNQPRSLPTVLIADTVKGKGVDFAENNNEWHYNNLNEELYKRAMKQNA